MTMKPKLSYPFDRCPTLDLPREYGDLRTGGRVVRVSHAGTTVWLTLGHEETRKVLSDPRFSRAELCTAVDSFPQTAEFSLLLKYDSVGVLGDADPPDHRRLRQALSQWFTSDHLDDLRPRITELIAGLLEEMAKSDRPAPFLRAVARPLVDKVQFTLLYELAGIPESGRDEAYHWMRHLFTFNLDSTQDEIRAVAQRCEDYFRDLITVKRRQPGDDPLSRLLAGTAADGVTDQELALILLGIIRGGYNTMPITFAHCVLTLLRYPGWWDKLARDNALIAPAVEECLRYSPPAERNGMRRALVDVELGGVTIPAGSVVIPGSMSASYDPDNFPEPEDFDPLRTGSNQHLAFGFGPHFCPGAPLARFILRQGISALVRCFPTLRLAVPATELMWIPNDHLVPLRGFDELPLTW